MVPDRLCKALAPAARLLDDRHHQNVTRNRADELEPSLRMYEDEMAAIERLALRRPAIQHVVTHGLDSVR